MRHRRRVSALQRLRNCSRSGRARQISFVDLDYNWSGFLLIWSFVVRVDLDPLKSLAVGTKDAFLWALSASPQVQKFLVKTLETLLRCK